MVCGNITQANIEQTQDKRKVVKLESHKRKHSLRIIHYYNKVSLNYTTSISCIFDSCKIDTSQKFLNAVAFEATSQSFIISVLLVIHSLLLLFNCFENIPKRQYSLSNKEIHKGLNNFKAAIITVPILLFGNFFHTLYFLSFLLSFPFTVIFAFCYLVTCILNLVLYVIHKFIYTSNMKFYLSDIVLD